jgi:hypothetical protein
MNTHPNMTHQQEEASDAQTTNQQEQATDAQSHSINKNKMKMTWSRSRSSLARSVSS